MQGCWHGWDQAAVRRACSRGAAYETWVRLLDVGRTRLHTADHDIDADMGRTRLHLLVVPPWFLLR
jgi:hypothetical protein